MLQGLSGDMSEISNYDASKIDKLEGLEAVRKKPGMYIGDPDERGCTIAFSRCWTIPSTNIWPATATRIEVTIHVDGSISIRDNGRGIPVDIHPKFKIPASSWC